MGVDEPARSQGGRGLLRFLPILIIALGAAAFFLSGAHNYLTFAAIKENYRTLAAFVETHFWISLALYMLAYVGVTALSIPGASIMSVLGGFLFGNATGTSAAVVSATIGATLIFLAARLAIAGWSTIGISEIVRKLEAGFSKNAFSYLLLLRLMPLFPFFLVNIASAFTRIKTSTYILATSIGIIPGAFAFVSAGNGLGAVFERDGDLKLKGLLLQPEILTPIIALSALAAIPILYRAIKKDPAESGA